MVFILQCTLQKYYACPKTYTIPHNIVSRGLDPVMCEAKSGSGFKSKIQWFLAFIRIQIWIQGYFFY